MEQITILTVLFVLVLLGACGDRTVNGASKAMPVSVDAVKPTPPPPKTPEVNFDPSAQSVQKDFDLDALDADKVFWAIHQLNLAQDKFENDVAYNKRLDALGSSVLFGQVRLNGKFAFRLPSSSFYIGYNANKAAFVYEVMVHEIDDKFNGVEVGSKYQYLQLTNSLGLSHITGSLKVEPERAKALDGQLGILLVGSIVPPYARTELTYDRKLHDSTGEIKGIDLRLLRFTVEGAWIVHNSTGEVLTKKWVFKRIA